MFASQKKLAILVFLFALFFTAPFAVEFAQNNPLGKGDSLSIQTLVAKAEECSIWPPSSWFTTCLSNGLTHIMYYLFISWPYAMVSLADALFSMSFFNLIVDFASYFNDYFKDAVDSAWLMSRDLANLVIVSMFLFAAVGTILRLPDYNLDKFIIKIILVAVLINFSMFAVKFAVDVSNIIAYQFYKEIGKLTESNAEEGDEKERGIYIGAAIMKKIGIDGYSASEEFKKKVNSGNISRLYMPLLTLVIIMLAGALVYGSVVIFTRFLGLMLVMALSAVGFVMLVVPQIGRKYFDMWWQNLLKYSLFAPIFSFMLLLSISIMGLMGGSDTTMIEAMSQSDWINAFLWPFVVIGLLFASIKISNSLSIMGSNFATKFAAGGAMTLAALPYTWAYAKARNSNKGLRGIAEKIVASKKLERLANARIIGGAVNTLRYKAMEASKRKASPALGGTALAKKIGDSKFGLKFHDFTPKGLSKEQLDKLKEGTAKIRKKRAEMDLKNLEKKKEKSGYNQATKRVKETIEKVKKDVKESDRQNATASEARAKQQEKEQDSATQHKITQTAQRAKEEAAQATLKNISEAATQNSDEALKTLRERVQEAGYYSRRGDMHNAINHILGAGDRALNLNDYSGEIAQTLEQLNKERQDNDMLSAENTYKKLIDQVIFKNNSAEQAKEHGEDNSAKKTNERDDGNATQEESLEELVRSARRSTTQDIPKETLDAFAQDFKNIIQSISDKENRVELQGLANGSAANHLTNATKVFMSNSPNMKQIAQETVSFEGQNTTMKEALSKLFEKHGIDTSLFNEETFAQTKTANTPENAKKRSWWEQRKRDWTARKIKKFRVNKKKLEAKERELKAELAEAESALEELSLKYDPVDIARRASRLDKKARKNFVKKLSENLEQSELEEIVKSMQKQIKKDT